MQLKKQGSSYSVIRTVYSAEKKRGVPTSLGTIAVGSTHIPEELATQLTADELSDVKQKLNAFSEQSHEAAAKSSLSSLQYFVDSATESLNKGFRFSDENKAHELYKRIAELKLAMRKAGYKRPRPAPAAAAPAPQPAALGAVSKPAGQQKTEKAATKDTKAGK